MWYYGIDYTYIIFVVPAIIISLFAQMKVSSTFNKYMEKIDYMLEKLNKKQINDLFYGFLMLSEFGIEKKYNDKEPCIVIINDGVRRFELHYILKNISDGGWTDSYENIKRIQVGNVRDNLVSTNKIRTHMLCGFIKYKDKHILVVWNSYRYTTHNTNRSCYVNLESIIKCYDRGYIFSNDFEQEIWLCDEKHFGLLIRDYINFNYIME